MRRNLASGLALCIALALCVAVPLSAARRPGSTASTATPQGAYQAAIAYADAKMATPGAIGGTTPAAGTFTTLSLAAGTGGINGASGTGAFRFGTSAATVAFFGATPSARAASYTQTYSTAARDVPADTSNTITDNSGGTPSVSELVTVTDIAGSADVGPVKNNFATLAAELALIKADCLETKKVVNALIDDAQAYGLAP